MPKFTIAGVPEHFNLPWHQVLESGIPAEWNIDAQWQDYPAGTGAMVNALNNGDADIAMLVTEGAVAARQLAGCRFEIISFYTTSPLLWGMHVAAGSALETPGDFLGRRYAISRYGSGSHLMAKVHAQQQGWPVAEMEFVLVENLDGARAALREKRAEVFFWEHFTTKPYVDNGEFRWLGDFPPPWPGFVVCANRDALAANYAVIDDLLARVFAQAAQIKQNPDSPALIAKRYQLQQADVRAWLAATRWVDERQLDQQLLESVAGTLALAAG